MKYKVIQGRNHALPGAPVSMENAPYWYGTHLDKLDFEWSMDEAHEIERYCERILKNCEEEEMTPRDRFLAHLYAKPGEKNADRRLVCFSGCVVFDTRTLDCHGMSLLPIDVYRSPKLMVKAKLATIARYKCDYACTANIIYTEDLWGGNTRMVDYGNPSLISSPPIKTMKDLEALKGYVPDPYSAGLYPGTLWFYREMRRIYTEYNIPLPLWKSMCPGPTEVVQLGMLGWTGFQMALRRDPDLAKACAKKGLEWDKAFGKAIIDVCHPEAMYCCQFTGGFPMKGNEWVMDLWHELGTELKNHSLKVSKYKVPGKPDGNLHIKFGYSFLTGIFEWYNMGFPKGMFNPEMWDGGVGGWSEGVDFKKVIDWHRDHNTFIGFGIPNTTLEKGPISEIEGWTQKCINDFGHHRKYSINVFPIYFCPQAHADAAMAAAKKVSKL